LRPHLSACLILKMDDLPTPDDGISAFLSDRARLADNIQNTWTAVRGYSELAAEESGEEREADLAEAAAAMESLRVMLAAAEASGLLTRREAAALQIGWATGDGVLSGLFTFVRMGRRATHSQIAAFARLRSLLLGLAFADAREARAMKAMFGGGELAVAETARDLASEWQS